MNTIAYYISDHGWGHAARSICIIQKFLEVNPEIKVIVCSDQPMPFLRAALSTKENPLYDQEHIAFHPIGNDFGFASHKITGQIDLETTRHKAASWIKTWEDYLTREYLFLKRQDIDIILSDIPPQPFILAKKLGCPGIAIGNFSWLDLYPQHYFPNSILDPLWNAYRNADLAFRLPFSLDMTVFRSQVEVPLVAREPTRTPRELRKELGIDCKQLAVYVSSGLSISNPFSFESIAPFMADRKDEIVILVAGKPRNPPKNVFRVPLEDPNGQDFIACCDIALLKPGFSSVGEAIRSKTPILSYNIQQSRELHLIEHQITSLGIAEAISTHEFNSGEWVKKIALREELRRNYDQIPARFRQKGEDVIIPKILELLVNS